MNCSATSYNKASFGDFNPITHACLRADTHRQKNLCNLRLPYEMPFVFLFHWGNLWIKMVERSDTTNFQSSIFNIQYSVNAFQCFIIVIVVYLALKFLQNRTVSMFPDFSHLSCNSFRIRCLESIGKLL